MDFETKNAVERLRLGGADQRDRDRVLCYLADTRWTEAKLADKIERKHNELCRVCPVRTGAVVEERPHNSGIRSRTERLLFWAVLALIGILSAVIGNGFKP